MVRPADPSHIKRFEGTPLGEILSAELAAGNELAGTWRGDFSKVQNVTFAQLRCPFQTPIQRGIEGITFQNVNDPHYWKAEYYDKARGLLLVCGFGRLGDFGNL